MPIHDEIKKLEQKIARLERSSSLQKMKQRKLDTRQKIQFGGLIIKAKMNAYSKDIILGALLDAKDKIESSLELKQQFQKLGQNAFLENAHQNDSKELS